MKQFSTEEQERFWGGHEEAFKGETVSPEILRLTKKYFGKTIIDAGAGNGAFLKTIKSKLGLDAVGYDLVPRDEMVKKGDCTKVTEKDASFDTYISTDVIEHLSDEHLKQCLQEAHRVLQPGGHAIFETVNEENLELSRVTCPSCGEQFHRWGHCQSFTAERLHKLLEEAGFTVCKTVKTNLTFRAKFGTLMRVFYGLGLHKLLGFKFLTADLIVVAKKTKE